MFPVSASSQTGSRNRYLNSRSVGAFKGVRFGCIPPAEDKEGKFTQMQGALKAAMPKYGYTIDEDLYTNYKSKLTFDRAQSQIKHLLNTVTGADLGNFHQAGKLGLVEESSDMFFEMYTLKALYSGLISKEQVRKWADLVPVAPDSGKTVKEQNLLDGSLFKEKLKVIRKDIETRANQKSAWPIGQIRSRAFNHFRNEVNRGWADVSRPEAQDRALDLLALIGMKFALMTRKDPNYRIWGDNFKLLYDEAEEFREEMHGDSASDTPAKWLVAGLASLYSLPYMPYRPFQWLITKLAGQQLNYADKADSKGSQANAPRFDIDYKDLMETVFSKQIGRQELDFSRPDIDARLQMRPDIRLNKDAMKNGNAKRKCILKPYELWQESAVLKNATLGDAKIKDDIAGKVLNTGLDQLKLYEKPRTTSA